MKEFGTPLTGMTYVDRPGAYAFLRSPDRSRLAVIATPHGLFLPGGGLDPGDLGVLSKAEPKELICLFVRVGPSGIRKARGAFGRGGGGGGGSVALRSC